MTMDDEALKCQTKKGPQGPQRAPGTPALCNSGSTRRYGVQRPIMLQSRPKSEELKLCAPGA